MRDLGGETFQLVQAMLRRRLLPFITEELPSVEKMVLARSEPWARMDPKAEGWTLEGVAEPGSVGSLRSMHLRFPPNEPAVNRYAKSGFAPHTDHNFALTVSFFCLTKLRRHSLTKLRRHNLTKLRRHSLIT